MKYTLKAHNIWEIGKREKQEDSIFPEYGQANESDRLFILCDGMGGHSGGEIASSTICQAMSEHISLNSINIDAPFTDEDFEQALEYAYDALDMNDNGNEKKMGSTLTFLKFHSQGCTIAHIGDSRVYHIRPGVDADETEILFQTTDHSLVNDLVKIGELTEEEAKHSPQKNIITRAMQPNMEYRSKADIYHTYDIKPGDYFMMCSDGILENMEENNIKYIFSEKTGDITKKAEMLIKVTKENNDNHSAILVQITEVIGEAAVILPEEHEHVEQADEIAPININSEKVLSIPVKHILTVIIIAILLYCGYVTYKYFQQNEVPSTEQQNDKPSPSMDIINTNIEKKKNNDNSTKQNSTKQNKGKAKPTKESNTKKQEKKTNIDKAKEQKREITNDTKPAKQENSKKETDNKKTKEQEEAVTNDTKPTKQENSKKETDNKKTKEQEEAVTNDTKPAKQENSKKEADAKEEINNIINKNREDIPESDADNIADKITK